MRFRPAVRPRPAPQMAAAMPVHPVHAPAPDADERAALVAGVAGASWTPNKVSCLGRLCSATIPPNGQMSKLDHSVTRHFGHLTSISGISFHQMEFFEQRKSVCRSAFLTKRSRRTDDARGFYVPCELSKILASSQNEGFERSLKQSCKLDCKLRVSEAFRPQGAATVAAIALVTTLLCTDAATISKMQLPVGWPESAARPGPITTR